MNKESHLQPGDRRWLSANLRWATQTQIKKMISVVYPGERCYYIRSEWFFKKCYPYLVWHIYFLNVYQFDSIKDKKVHKYCNANPEKSNAPLYWVNIFRSMLALDPWVNFWTRIWTTWERMDEGGSEVGGQGNGGNVNFWFEQSICQQ